MSGLGTRIAQMGNPAGRPTQLCDGALHSPQLCGSRDACTHFGLHQAQVIHVACRASMPESSSPTLPTLLIDHEAVLGCAATLHPASCVHVTCVGMCQLCCSYLTGRYTTAIVSAV